MHLLLISFLSVLGFAVYAHHPSNFLLYDVHSQQSMFINDTYTTSELEEES